MTTMKQEYDVVIMGGGPGGSTLGALLRKKSDLRVALFEEAIFPREHIGESMAHPVTSALEQSGALGKVLAADCWIKKYGGIYAWNPNGPSVTYFDHHRVTEDGIARWTIHTDRAQFDHILLNHAADMGVDVFQGTPVKQFKTAANGCVLTLADGTEVRAKIFVDASGRHDSIATGKKRKWLSDYRNIAIWNHYTNCKFVQHLEGDWNIFREENVSPIGCFAYEDGWVWYIPIRKLVKGRVRTLHSVGLVTDPSILKERDFTNPDVFEKRLKEAVPLLKDLIQDAERVDDQMLTVTNYSMLNENFCNYDERWILLGDSAFFVDPLFSSGVAFATGQAVGVSLIIKSTLDSDLTERDKRDLWRDYDARWHITAETFGLAIDQWYHDIANFYPKSVYWNSRGRTRADLNIREASFHAMVDTGITPDLIRILTQGSLDTKALDKDGPFLQTQGVVLAQEPNDTDLIAIAPDVAIRESLSVDVPGFKAAIVPTALPQPVNTALRDYWVNPIANGDKIQAPLDKPLRCHRIYFESQGDEGTQVPIVNERDGGLHLWNILQEGPIAYGKLKPRLRVSQQIVLGKLLHAKLLAVHRVETTQEIEPAPTATVGS